jgi:hypothetical protein
MDQMDNTQICAVFFMLLPVVYPDITVPQQSSGYRLPHVMCATLCDYKVTPTNISDHEFKKNVNSGKYIAHFTSQGL